MKNLLIKVAVLLLVFCTPLLCQSLNENLKILKPFVGKNWIGMLNSPDGLHKWEIGRVYESIWNGNVIKCTKTNDDLSNSSEGYFYWDDVGKKIAFFFIENNGAFLKGFVSMDGNIISLEGKMTWPKQMNSDVKQQYDFKNTFEFTHDGKMIDRWYMNAFGPWREGHVIEFNCN